MADISKITTLDGNTYDLKDATARSVIPHLNELYTSASETGSIVAFTAHGSGLPMKSIIANLKAKQDFHGYGYPWFNGTSKNKL